MARGISFWSYHNGKAFRSLTLSAQSRVLHVVDLAVFCGIFASFLD